MILMISCSKEASMEDIGYFPLHVGNQWDYIKGDEVRTDAIVTLDDKQYYRFISSTPDFRDTTYYRRVENKIYETKDGSHEYLKFDLDPKENETWELSFVPNAEDKYIATLRSRDVVIETDNFIFEDCFEFYYDIPRWADDEFTIFLAKGIGIVKQIYWGGFPMEPGLKRVLINGVETVF
jgi:hypothetical protein